MYSGYGVEYNGEGSWSCGNDFGRNVTNSGVDNSWLYHTNNHKNNFLLLGGQPTDDINEDIGAAHKIFSINFSKAKTIFCLSFHYSFDNSYLFVNGKIYISLKQIIKMLTLHLNLVEKPTNKFVESVEVSLIGYV